MSKPRFLADQDFDDHILTGVTKREPLIEIVRCRDIGLSRTADAEILKYAADQGFIVLSHDVNTMTAAAYSRLTQQEPIAGLLIAIQERPIGPIIDNLVLIWQVTEAEEWRDRVRWLPV